MCLKFGILKRMQPDIQQQLDEQSAKLDAIWRSVEKTRKYFLILMWGSIIMVALPLVGLMLAIPKFIDMYTTTLNGLL